MRKIFFIKRHANSSDRIFSLWWHHILKITPRICTREKQCFVLLIQSHLQQFFFAFSFIHFKCCFCINKRGDIKEDENTYHENAFCLLATNNLFLGILFSSSFGVIQTFFNVFCANLPFLWNEIYSHCKILSS